MFSRPKSGENEEDLLRLESEYLSKVINPKVKPVVCKAKEEVLIKKRSDNIVKDPLDIVDLSDGIVIREKCDVIKCMEMSDGQPISKNYKGFPEPFRRDKTIQSSCGKSIFAKQLQAKRERKTGHLQQTKEEQSKHKKQKFGESSAILDNASGGDTMIQEIHEENIRKLEALSEEEIVQQRNALLSQLSPELIDIFKKKRSGGRVEVVANTFNVCPVITEKIEEDIEDGTGEEASEELDKLKVGKKVVTEGISPDCQKSDIKVVDVAELGDKDFKNEDMVTESVEVEIPEDLAEGVLQHHWLHMNIKEGEKLKWIGELPKPNPANQDSGHVARFDFEGVILPYDADLPVTKALHHHGSEPGRAGYTLDELLILSRSSVAQQRMLALSTLTAILKMAKEGYYDSCLDEPLLPLLVERDILTLFRFSLDENSHLNLLPAATAISQLIVDGPDEVCLDLLLGLPRALEQPCLAPKSPSKVTVEINDNLVARGDLVKGALRMDVLPRIRYILEVLRPPPKVVISALELLTRIGRHSMDAAHSVASFPRLISVIFNEFLPSTWKRSANIVQPLDMPSIYGVPLAKAVKLMRILACCSPSFAYTAVKKFQIMKSLLAYVSIDPSESSLPQRESLTLTLESYYLWQVLLSYGLTADYYVEFSPLLLRQLQYHHCVSMEMEVSSKCFDHEYATALMGLLENSLNVSQDGVILSPGSHLYSVGSQHLGVILEPLLLCLRKWCTELARADKVPKFSALKVVGSCLSFLSTAYSKVNNVPSRYAKEIHESTKCIIEECLEKFMKSHTFSLLMERLWSHSSLRPTEWTRVVRDPVSLPSAGGVRWRGEVTPILRSTGPLPLLLPLANFLLSVASSKDSPKSQIITEFLCNNNLLEYVNNISKSKELNNDWFCRYEVHFIISVVRLAARKVSVEDMVRMQYHTAALKMVPLLSTDDKHLKVKLFEEVIFEPAFFGESSQLTSGIISMDLEDQHAPWISAAGHTTDEPKIVLIEKALKNLALIGSQIKNLLGLLDKDEGCVNRVPDFPSLFHHPGNSGNCLGAIWPYKLLANLCGPEKEQSATEPTPPEKVVTAEACLQWILLLEFLCPLTTASISPTLRFSYLTYIFLAGNDLFLEKSIHAHLSTILRKVLKPGYETLDFDELFPDLTPFKDLYVRLLAQFDAVSYGDALFSHVILLPLARKHNLNYRLLVWGERADVLRACSTSLSQLMVPLQSFLEPPEKDPVLLELYLRSLAVGIVRKTRNPVPFSIAVHHLGVALKENLNENSYVSHSVCQSLRKKVEKLPDKSLVDLLLNYTSFDAPEDVFAVTK